MLDVTRIVSNNCVLTRRCSNRNQGIVTSGSNALIFVAVRTVIGNCEVRRQVGSFNIDRCRSRKFPIIEKRVRKNLTVANQFGFAKRLPMEPILYIEILAGSIIFTLDNSWKRTQTSSDCHRGTIFSLAFELTVSQMQFELILSGYRLGI